MAIASKSSTPWVEGEAERKRHAMKRMSHEAERREPERAAGLLGERWTREPSNSRSAATSAPTRCVDAHCERNRHKNRMLAIVDK